MSDIDNVMDGTICMSCHQLLMTEEDVICSAMHPLYCEECWKNLSRHEQRYGPPYFCEKTGEVLTGESHE